MVEYDLYIKGSDLMGNISGLTGTPWHIEVIGNSEDDDRRHRSRCSFYTEKKTSYCNYYKERCRGAAHCLAYREKNTNVNPRQVPENDVKPFDDIRLIKISKIIVPKDVFKKHSDEKVKYLIDFYNRNQRLDKPIVVECYRSNYLLVDKYMRYLVAKQLGINELYAEMGSQEDVRNWNELRKKGTLVWVNKLGEVGEVVDFSISKVTIRFDNGVVQDYDIHKCISPGTIRVL